jgi:hypothetical protein
LFVPYGLLRNQALEIRMILIALASGFLITTVTQAYFQMPTGKESQVLPAFFIWAPMGACSTKLTAWVKQYLPFL